MGDSSDDFVIDDDEFEIRNETTRPSLHRNARKSTTDIKETSSAPTTYTTRRQAAMLAKTKTDAKFMENFDPDNSNREKRKISRKLGIRKVPGAVYDETGVHIATGMDLCDCMCTKCDGCFYPCKKCGSNKCGNDCRCNRKVVPEDIVYQGYNQKFRNPILDKMEKTKVG